MTKALSIAAAVVVALGALEVGVSAYEGHAVSSLLNHPNAELARLYPQVSKFLSVEHAHNDGGLFNSHVNFDLKLAYPGMPPVSFPVDVAVHHYPWINGSLSRFSGSFNAPKAGPVADFLRQMHAPVIETFSGKVYPGGSFSAHYVMPGLHGTTAEKNPVKIDWDGGKVTADGSSSGFKAHGAMKSATFQLSSATITLSPQTIDESFSNADGQGTSTMTLDIQGLKVHDTQANKDLAVIQDIKYGWDAAWDFAKGAAAPDLGFHLKKFFVSVDAAQPKGNVDGTMHLDANVTRDELLGISKHSDQSTAKALALLPKLNGAAQVSISKDLAAEMGGVDAQLQSVGFAAQGDNLVMNVQLQNGHITANGHKLF